MNAPKDPQHTGISKARSLEEIADFWDTHSLADYWDQTHEVTFEVRAQRRRHITLAPDVYAQDGVQAHTPGRIGILKHIFPPVYRYRQLGSAP